MDTVWLVVMDTVWLVVMSGTGRDPGGPVVSPIASPRRPIGHSGDGPGVPRVTYWSICVRAGRPSSDLLVALGTAWVGVSTAQRGLVLRLGTVERFG